MFRGGSRAAATPKMECFVKIVNGFQPLTIVTKHSILDVAVALDPPLQLGKAPTCHNSKWIFHIVNHPCRRIQKVFFKKPVPKNFTNFTEKHLCCSHFFKLHGQDKKLTTNSQCII